MLEAANIFSDKGITSVIYEAKGHPGLVIKCFRSDKDLYGGALPLTNPEYRRVLRQDEVAVLGVTAQGLGAVIEQIRFQNGRIDDAIVMKKLRADEYVDDRLQKDNVPTRMYQSIADTVTQLHMNTKVCPSLQEEYPSLPDFIYTLLLGESPEEKGEISMLRGIFEENGNQLKTFNRWEEKIRIILEKKYRDLNFRGIVLGEPSFGHGDIESGNINISGDQVLLLDPAPRHIWRVNDLRMDASFFLAELLIQGNTEGAKEYWNRYNDNYIQKIIPARLGLENIPQKLLDRIIESNRAIDEASLLYRAIIFCKLTKLRGQPTQEQTSFQLVEHLLLENDWRDFKPQQ